MAPGIGISVSPVLGGGFSWARYWAARNLLSYSSRDENTLLETESGDSLNATILPAVFKGNGSGNYRVTNGNLISSDDWVIKLEFEITVDLPAGNVAFFSQGGVDFRVEPGSSRWRLKMDDGATRTDLYIASADLAIEKRKYELIISHDKDGATTVTEDGETLLTNNVTFTNTADNHFFIGSRSAFDYVTSDYNLIEYTIYSDLAQNTLVAKYILTGDADAYDVSGNNNHALDNNIAAANKSYSTNGSLYSFENGWTLWYHATSDDIRVPSGSTTDPIDTGYSILKEYPGSVTEVNMADCLIGFNESESADSKLAIFDRSDTDIHEDASRSSDYYDATNLATKSRYHIDELHPFDKFVAFFKTAYKNRVYPGLNISGSNFAIDKINTYSEKATGSGLSYLLGQYSLDGEFSVGTDLNFRSIQRAIDYSYNGYTLNIEDGTYAELLTVNKEISFVGSGVNGALLYYVNEVAAAPADIIQITANSSFENITIDNYQNSFGASKNNILVDGCTVNFTDCQICRFINDTLGASKPMYLQNAAIVNMNNCIIEAANTDGNQLELEVNDTSQFNFTRGTLQCRLVGNSTSEITVDCDTWYLTRSVTYGGGIILNDSATASIHVATGQINLDRNTNEPLGWAPFDCAHINDSASLTMTGNNYISGPRILSTGNGAEILIKDFTSVGHFWLEFHADSVNCLATFDNADIYFDVDSDDVGLHIIEDAGTAHSNETRIINGSVLEFSGHNGDYFTMGNPVTNNGALTITDSTIIDNVNDNIPYGANYEGCVLVHNKATIVDSTITNQNWDGVGSNKCLNFQKPVGTSIEISLTNVVLNNDEVNTPVYYFNGDEANLDANDYICETNVTKNTSAANDMGIHTGNAVTAYATLIGNCPS